MKKKRVGQWPWSRPAIQLLLPFQARRERLETIFRRGIVVTTFLGIIGILLVMVDGRAALFAKLRQARWSATRSIGLEPDRADVDADWADRRGRREIQTRESYRRNFEKMTPSQRALLLAGGMGPDDAVVRWGNYDMTFVFSSKVFVRDDDGRYYRFRPDTRSVLFRQGNFVGLDTCQYYLPDTPEIRRLAKDAGSTITVEGSQATNSWGCRGPEPDMNAPLRGLVLGDSFMQGYLLNDEETPPMCIQQSLQSALGVPTTILNTGVLGYGPEHEYNTLRALGDRFRPQFVVVAVYANDFGDEADVFQGRGDWAEGKHWLEQILGYCRTRKILCLIAPVPSERQVVGSGHIGDYPGQVSNITQVPSEFFCDPNDAFVAENLRINLQEKRKGKPNGSLLYNGHLHDGHLSPRGAVFWGNIVGRRLAMLLEARKVVAGSD